MTLSSSAIPADADRGTADAGSVLVDALVGLGILAITLTLASQAIQSGLQRSLRQEDTRMAQLLARSRLAAVGADIPLAAGRSQGVDGPLAWSVGVAPQGRSDGLVAVSVQVTGRDGAKLADVQSLRIAEP